MHDKLITFDNNAGCTKVLNQIKNTVKNKQCLMEVIPIIILRIIHDENGKTIVFFNWSLKFTGLLVWDHSNHC